MPEKPKTRRPEVVAVYYPHWHNYDHGSAWKGEGWTEWEGMKAAVPRFAGHNHPLKPVWGCFDESDPVCVEREIDLAADHGIDVFMYDWYWYSGVRNMEEALEQGFLKARNRDRMKFCLMWANHDRVDQFCPELGKPRNVWLPSRHSARDLNRVIDYGIEHYFREPTYWRVDGGLFFSIYQPARFIRELGGPGVARALFAEIDKRLDAEGLPPMHWSGMTRNAAEAAVMEAGGFHTTGAYNIHTGGKAQPDGTEDYEHVMRAHREHWQAMGREKLPNMPVVTMGWDPTPRCRQDVPWPFPKEEYPYVPVVVGNTPERFEQLLKDAARHAAGDPKKPPAVTIYCWNEWTEGGYLLPEESTGTAYLEAVKAAFPPRGE